MRERRPGANSAGSGLEGQAVNSVVKFTAGSRVFASFTPHSGTADAADVTLADVLHLTRA